ncbi:MAG: transcriptional regulator [Bacteroidetes bacterium 43-93]|nr:response regulator [Bacteroidota bacterium]OJW97428.1 MAG: transcriptional regulator [Bacteroidetes bacterium 43-93]
MKTILLIEDNEEIRENAAEILSLGDYNVLTAPDGKEGIAIAQREKPDVIICDIMMPVLDGYGVIQLLQKNPATQNIPFIFLTAKAERAEMRKGMELGADDYITKPFTGTELLTAVESRLKKIELLKLELQPGINGFNTLMEASGSKDAMMDLAREHDVTKYKKKQVIYHEGGNPLRLYYLQKGKVKAYKSHEDGKELIVNLYNEGDFFGYIALLENTAYNETAEAMEECEIVLIPKQKFEHLVLNDREIMKKFIQLLANNVTDKEHKLLSLAYSSLRKRVADALVMLNKKYRRSETETFVIDMSRENLASIAGTVKESLIRTLSDFKDEKLIDIKGGDITILDEKKLENLVG